MYLKVCKLDDLFFVNEKEEKLEVINYQRVMNIICIKDLGKLELFDGNYDFFELELYE